MGENNELDRFKRRLIRTVGRLREQKCLELWANVEKAMGKDCQNMWKRMRSLTLKKMSRLLACGDMPARLSPLARMSLTDWLLLDFVLVHENIDSIDAAQPGSEPAPLVTLFTLVQNFKLEVCSEQNLAERWASAAVHYNQNGRQCSPMLLQRRWYDLKAITRQRFYRYWEVFRKTPDSADKPTDLNTAIATRYPHVVTQDMLTWTQMLEQNKIVLPQEFETILKLNEKPKSSPSDDTDDVVLIEPIIETIDVDLITELEEAAASSNSPEHKSEHLDGDNGTSVQEDTAETINDTDVVKDRVGNRVKDEVNKDKDDVVATADEVERPKDLLKETSEDTVMDIIETNIAIKQENIIHETECQEKDSTEVENEQTFHEPDGLSNVRIVALSHNEDLEGHIKKELDFDTNLTSVKTIAQGNENSTINALPVILKVETIATEQVEVLDVTSEDVDSPPSHEDETATTDIIEGFACRPGPKSKKHVLVTPRKRAKSLLEDLLIAPVRHLKVNKPGPRCTKDTSYSELENNTYSEMLSTSTVESSIEKKYERLISHDINKCGDNVKESDKNLKELQQCLNEPSTSSAVHLNVHEFDECDYEFADEEDDVQIDVATLKSLEQQHIDTVQTEETDDFEATPSSVISEHEDSSRDYIVKSERTSPKFDLKLLMLPVVYTLKLEDMDILKDIALCCTIFNNVVSLDDIEAQSKPKGVEFNLQEEMDQSDDKSNDISDNYAGECLNDSNNYDDIEEDTPRELQVVKETSYLFQKPLTRTYTPINLCKNPDFNRWLQRLSAGFLVQARNRQLLKACKPLTVDVQKAFEEKLVDGILLLKRLEKKVEVEEHNIINNIDSQSVTVAPSAMPVQSLFDKETVDMESLLPQIVEEAAPPQETHEEKDDLLRARQNKSIQLPDIEKVRLVNKQLLTAQVPPLQLEKKCVVEEKKVLPLQVDKKCAFEEKQEIISSEIRLGPNGEIFMGRKQTKTVKPKVTPSWSMPWYQRKAWSNENFLLKPDSLQRMIKTLTPEAVPFKPAMRKATYCCTAKRHSVLNAARCRLLINTKGELRQRRFQKVLNVHTCKNYNTCTCCCKHMLTAPPRTPSPPPIKGMDFLKRQLDDGSEIINALAGLEARHSPSPVPDQQSAVGLAPPVNTPTKGATIVTETPLDYPLLTNLLSESDKSDANKVGDIIDLDENSDKEERPVDNTQVTENENESSLSGIPVYTANGFVIDLCEDFSISGKKVGTRGRGRGRASRGSRAGARSGTRKAPNVKEKKALKERQALNEWQAVKEASKTAFGFEPIKRPREIVWPHLIPAHPSQKSFTSDAGETQPNYQVIDGLQQHTKEQVYVAVEGSESQAYIAVPQTQCMENVTMDFPTGTRIMLLTDGRIFATTIDGIPLRLTNSQHEVLRMLVEGNSSGQAVMLTKTSDTSTETTYKPSEPMQEINIVDSPQMANQLEIDTVSIPSQAGDISEINDNYNTDTQTQILQNMPCNEPNAEEAQTSNNSELQKKFTNILNVEQLQSNDAEMLVPSSQNLLSNETNLKESQAVLEKDQQTNDAEMLVPSSQNLLSNETNLKESQAVLEKDQQTNDAEMLVPSSQNLLSNETNLKESQAVLEKDQQTNDAEMLVPSSQNSMFCETKTNEINLKESQAVPEKDHTREIVPRDGNEQSPVKANSTQNQPEPSVSHQSDLTMINVSEKGENNTVSDVSLSELVTEATVEDTIENNEVLLSPIEISDSPENRNEESDSEAPVLGKFLSVKNFAKIPRSTEDVETPSAESNLAAGNSILSDLMEISGISAEDTKAGPPISTPNILQEWTNVGISPNSLVLTPVTPGIETVQTSPKGKFYMYNSLTGQVTPLSVIHNPPGTQMTTPLPNLVPITKDTATIQIADSDSEDDVARNQLLNILHKKKGQMKERNKRKVIVIQKMPAILKRQQNLKKYQQIKEQQKASKQLKNKKKRKTHLEAKIDLVDSDAPMEEEYLYNSGDSDDENLQHLSRKRKRNTPEKVIEIDIGDSSDDEPLSKMATKNTASKKSDMDENQELENTDSSTATSQVESNVSKVRHNPSTEQVLSVENDSANISIVENKSTNSVSNTADIHDTFKGVIEEVVKESVTCTQSKQHKKRKRKARTNIAKYDMDKVLEENVSKSLAATSENRNVSLFEEPNVKKTKRITKSVSEIQASLRDKDKVLEEIISKSLAAKSKSRNKSLFKESNVKNTERITKSVSEIQASLGDKDKVLEEIIAKSLASTSVNRNVALFEESNVKKKTKRITKSVSEIQASLEDNREMEDSVSLISVESENAEHVSVGDNDAVYDEDFSKHPDNSAEVPNPEEANSQDCILGI